MTINVQDISKDLEATDLTMVGTKNGPDSDPVVVYTNTYKGRTYTHIRSVYHDGKKWAPGKGVSFDPKNAKDIFTAIGKLG